MTALVEHRLLLQRSMVDDPARARRLFWSNLVLAVVAIAALVVGPFLSSPWSLVATMVVAWVVGRGALLGYWEASAYRSGWLDGRAQMVAALEESVRRGMGPADWLRGEADRDAAVLGLDPGTLTPDGGEGDG